jgi:hypothetical protein
MENNIVHHFHKNGYFPTKGYPAYLYYYFYTINNAAIHEKMCSLPLLFTYQHPISTGATGTKYPFFERELAFYYRFNQYRFGPALAKRFTGQSRRYTGATHLECDEGTGRLQRAGLV